MDLKINTPDPSPRGITTPRRSLDAPHLAPNSKTAINPSPAETPNVLTQSNKVKECLLLLNADTALRTNEIQSAQALIDDHQFPSDADLHLTAEKLLADLVDL